jgi:aspartate 1-decarboxylase
VVTIMAFGVFSAEEAKTLSPRVIVLDENNEIIMQKGTLRN